MSISEEMLQPKCPICGAQPVHTDEYQKFMICKECGHKENFDDFMDEFKVNVLNQLTNSLDSTFEKLAKKSKNIKFTKR
ncbi:Uncharacterised protein [Shewanella baltica]|uniref:hypothetical protein n=1 Tax=Shewanella baltica TaxID=62322 RepID=UPI000F6E3898|nr:hypothetical protein [Shewanella baltica]MCS6097782.1 hypothetical protein [Shewanella baltica]MCS6225318.1 hypothetical protein [Shewanella baltica]VEF26682.1 Uncharacterised protein [Shewanella baltica]